MFLKHDRKKNKILSSQEKICDSENDVPSDLGAIVCIIGCVFGQFLVLKLMMRVEENARF